MGERSIVGLARGEFGEEVVLTSRQDLVDVLKELLALLVGLVRGQDD